jgi:hypothetical protein
MRLSSPKLKLPIEAKLLRSGFVRLQITGAVFLPTGVSTGLPRGLTFLFGCA